VKLRAETNLVRVYSLKPVETVSSPGGPQKVTYEGKPAGVLALNCSADHRRKLHSAYGSDAGEARRYVAHVNYNHVLTGNRSQMVVKVPIVRQLRLSALQCSHPGIEAGEQFVQGIGNAELFWFWR
jgi:hypothetical protein